MTSSSRIAVVTGAGTGIGRAAALALLADGWSVALAGRRAEPLEETREMSGAGDRALVVPTDVSDETRVAALFEAVIGAFGRVDMLFNNAGGNAPGVPFEDLTADQWRHVVDVNLTGSFLCAPVSYTHLTLPTIYTV